MEYDPETNTYTSDGPTERLKGAEKNVGRLEDRVDTLERLVEEQGRVIRELVQLEHARDPRNAPIIRSGALKRSDDEGRSGRVW